MINPIIRYLRSISWKIGLVNRKFPGTRFYWSNHYKDGGNSGPGSYNRLASFKSLVLNTFIKKNNIQSIIDLGCGDGNQIGYLELPSYVGFDVTPEAISLCNEKFAGDKSKRFYLYDENFETKLNLIGKAELAMSLDVIFHLVENGVYFQYMKNLFQSSDKFVIIYSSNYNKHQTFHEKSRKFTDWIAENATDWIQIDFIKNKYPFDKRNPDHTSESDFYIFQKKAQ